jgi:carbon-monoxide dehydrogenase medium subunit
VGGSTIGASDAAAALAGKPLTAQTIAEAAELAAAAAQPRTDHRGTAEYKRHLVQVFVTRILGNTPAASGTGGGTETERAA